jgi:hypothetical protein
MKKMKVRPSRLASCLAERGFVQGPEMSSEGSISFVREAKTPEIYEWIIVHAAGKRAEAVSASIVISLTCERPLYKIALAEDRLLLDVADNQERGWSIVETDSAARSWEGKLAEIVPGKLAEFTREFGGELLRRTEDVRRSVKRYCAKLDLSKPIAVLIDELRPRGDSKLLGVAERCAWEYHPDAEDIFGLAWLCIVAFEKEIEASPTGFALENSNFHLGLQCRMYLLADWLILQQGR